MKYVSSILLLIALTTSVVSCKKEDKEEEVVIVNVSGDIHNDLEKFRHLIGDQLNTTTGAVSGRREINWDGVPDSFVGKALPNNFFNPTEPGSPVALQRGLAYAAGGEFRVSNNNFAEVNSNATNQFAAFSGTKTFANISANLWEVDFQVAGESTAASVKGFGIVFSDVDQPNSTSLEFFNGDRSLGKFFVKPHDASTSFSFLGVYFKNNERITRVRASHDGILTDNQKDISENGIHDLITLDDFLYSEPLKK
jgi:hypothetical protein